MKIDGKDKTYKGYSRWLMRVFGRRQDMLKRDKAKKSKNFESKIISAGYDRRKTDSKDGADLIPGKYYILPIGQTLDVQLYETKELDGDNVTQYLVTKITDRFFFIIPFSYAEYIIKFNYKRFDYDTFNANDALDEIYECDNWNKMHTKEIQDGYDQFAFVSNDIIHNPKKYVFDLGNNDYEFLVDTKQI